MKAIRKWGLVLVLLALLLALPGSALAQGQTGDKYVLGGTWTLSSGETLNGSLYVLGGSATLQTGSTVTGSVMLAGGTVDVQGSVEGDVIATGGLVSLGRSSVVQGNVSVIGANISRDPGAVVEGKVTNGFSGTPPLRFPFLGRAWSSEVQPFDNPIIGFFWYLLRSFLWAALAILVVLFLPRHVERLEQTVVAQPLIATGLGLLTVIVAPLMLVVIAITLIGIPVAFLGALALLAAWSFGLVGVGAEVGRRLAAVFNQDWPLATDAGVGIFVLTLVVNGIRAAVPCIGWVAPAVVGMLGLGAVLLTRFGTVSYPLPASPYVPPPGPNALPPE